MKIFSKDSRSPGRDFNPRPPEYEAGVLTTRPRVAKKRDNNKRINVFMKQLLEESVMAIYLKNTTWRGQQ
jgi:hypothetical protein